MRRRPRKGVWKWLQGTLPLLERLGRMRPGGPRSPGSQGEDLPQQPRAGTTYFSGIRHPHASEPQGPGRTSLVRPTCVEECRDFHTDLAPPLPTSTRSHAHLSTAGNYLDWEEEQGMRKPWKTKHVALGRLS